MILKEKLEKAETVIILGHIRPDGDCIGSSLGLYNYIREVYPEKKLTVYLDNPSEKFSSLEGFDEIIRDADKALEEVSGMDYLAICLDASDRERLGDGERILAGAGDSVCFDHHITNTGYTKDTVLDAKASSTCEVIYRELDKSRVSRAAAECLYTGLIHDTGVFKYSSASYSTMLMAGELMEKGIDFTDIIDGSFYRKTYLQNQILGRALLESVIFHEGKCIFSALNKANMEFYGVNSADLDGIIDQLRNTEGVEVAIFMYETETQMYKVSLRSNKLVDVSRVASYFGGGGHIRAAGCTMHGSQHDIINNLSEQISIQLCAEEK